MFIYTVKAGDTLWQIANNFRVSTNRLINANGLPNPNQLVVGQSVIIPTEDAIHIVAPGETLWLIANEYNTNVQAIMQANRITNPALIYPGSTLFIPAARHQVRVGETLSQIAGIYGVSIRSLINVNNIENPDLIYPGTTLIIPRKTRPTIDVNGYTIAEGQEAAAIVQEVGEHLTYLSPFAYIIKADGGLISIDDSPAIAAAYNKRAVPMLSVTNFTYQDPGSQLAHTVLSNPGLQETLITNMISIMKEKGYLGVNIDFENTLPEDREHYNQFLQRTVERMHAQNFFVSTALAPKTSGEQKGLLYEAHDYPAHGRIVDFVILMTYEWGYRSGPPQAISPLNQIKRVLDYAVSVIPRNKIFFGFQVYARDWLLPFQKGRVAETFDMQEAIRRAVRNGAVIQYDTVSQSPFYRYQDNQGRTHEVWFEDARSAQAKFDTVKAYKLRGISYWVLGYPFPQNWTLLEDNFTVRKRV